MSELPLGQMTSSVIAAVANLLLLFVAKPDRLLVRTGLRCVAFALFTVALFHDGVVPTQTPNHQMSPQYRFVWGALEIAWWLLVAATILAATHTYYELAGRLRERRFAVDVMGTLLYLTAALAIVTNVFDIPLKGVLATSGALAIILGLALQSTLSDLFSGLLINATAPYRPGDSVSFDGTSEGRVIEITWRATHLLSTNRDLIVVPNSTIAKSRIVNASVPHGPHAVMARFQAPPGLRPSDVVRALQLAIETCVGIAEHPVSTIATRSIGHEAIDYDIRFFVSERSKQEEVLNRFYDAAHRHLESISALLIPADREAGRLEYSFIEGISVFGLLSHEDRTALARTLIRRELIPGQIVFEAGKVPEVITILGYGILAASRNHNDPRTDVMRFAPYEYVGEGGPIAGLSINFTVTARTYAIVYELPVSAIKTLLKEHPDVAHALAARLALRVREGQAMMQPTPETPATPHGLAAWIAKSVRLLHQLHS